MKACAYSQCENSSHHAHLSSTDTLINMLFTLTSGVDNLLRREINHKCPGSGKGLEILKILMKRGIAHIRFYKMSNNIQNVAQEKPGIS